MIDEPPTKMDKEDEEEVQTPLDETAQAEASPETMSEIMNVQPSADQQEAQEASLEPKNESAQANTAETETTLEPHPLANKAEDEKLPDQPFDKSPSDKTLDNVTVRVDFRVGEITMPVNELASLAPGFTLTDLPGLTFPRAQAISAGRVFAEGELVDIEGKIGFRITRLLP